MKRISPRIQQTNCDYKPSKSPFNKSPIHNRYNPNRNQLRMNILIQGPIISSKIKPESKNKLSVSKTKRIHQLSKHRPEHLKDYDNDYISTKQDTDRKIKITNNFYQTRTTDQNKNKIEGKLKRVQDINQIQGLLRDFKTKYSKIQKKLIVKRQPQIQVELKNNIQKREYFDNRLRKDTSARKCRYSQNNLFYTKDNNTNNFNAFVTDKNSNKASTNAYPQTIFSVTQPFSSFHNSYSTSSASQKSFKKIADQNHNMNQNTLNIKKISNNPPIKHPRFSLESAFEEQFMNIRVNSTKLIYDKIVLSENEDNDDDADSVVLGTFYDEFPRLGEGRIGSGLMKNTEPFVKKVVNNPFCNQEYFKEFQETLEMGNTGQKRAKFDV